MSILNSAAKLVAKTRFKCIDKAPELHFIAGTVMLVATGVSAAKRSLSFQEILKERRSTIEDVERDIEADEKISDKDGEKKKVHHKITIATIYQTVKNWLPTFIFGFLSVFFYGKGFGIIQGRLSAAVGVCAALATENEQLRGLVNKSEESAIESAEEISYDDDTKSEEAVPSGDLSIFQRYFGPSNPNFEMNNRANNRFWLNKKIDYLKTMKLDLRGYLFLNEAFDTFSFEKSDSGQIFGWMKYDDPEEAKKHGGCNDVYITIEDADDGIGYIVTFHVDKEPLTGRVRY